MAHPGYHTGEPQRWNPGAGGPPPADFRQGGAPPRRVAGGGRPPRTQPSMTGLPTFSGYEQVGGFNALNFAPPPPPPPPPGPPPPMEFSDIAQLDEAACRQALLHFVQENCCYGEKPVHEMSITHFHGLTAFHYTLETYTESRKTGYKHTPYKGGYVDGPENGPPPPPWSIPCVANTLFVNQKTKIEVPHTATVRPCHECQARGYFRCWECHGWGQTVCDPCDGRGWHEHHTPEGMHRAHCHNCHGDGIARCNRCGGDGRITCDECDGYRNIKSFIQLVVSFKNHKVDHIVERSDMPDELIRHAQGDVIFEQCYDQVYPITSYPVQEINANSIRLVENHKTAFPNKRQLKQRQQLRAVPVTEVHYSWKDISTKYWIYGLRRQVHAPDYPDQCCCTIL